MSARRYLSRILGGIQCVIGAAASIFAYALYASAWVREELSIGNEDITFLMFMLLVFGVFSMVSGMILLREEC